MKKDIHPKYYPEAKVICACGNTWTTGSTVEEIHTDMCSACHPFFTGEQRIVDTAGQVDRFQRRKERADKMAEAKTGRDKGKKSESLFEIVTEDKLTAQETLQAKYPEVAKKVAEEQAQKAAAEAQRAAAQAAAPDEHAKGKRPARPPRDRKPRAEAAGSGSEKPEPAPESK